MNDIPVKFTAMIQADPTLISLMGIGVEGDGRVYRYYNADAYVDSVRKVYITWSLISGPRQTGGVEEPVYSFIIWGRLYDDVVAVRDRLVVLFGKKGITTGAGRQLYGLKVHEQDSFQEQPNYDGITLHFQFGYLALSAVS